MTRVAVLDDDQDVLDVLADILTHYGFDAVKFGHPISRIEELARARPDLIMIDLRMDEEREELSGLQTVHAARTSAELREVPIIVCTADVFGLHEAWPQLMERGDVHQLTKPFDLRTFERVIGMALGQAPRPSQRSGTVGAEDMDSKREA